MRLMPTPPFIPCCCVKFPTPPLQRFWTTKVQLSVPVHRACNEHYVSTLHRHGPVSHRLHPNAMHTAGSGPPSAVHPADIFTEQRSHLLSPPTGRCQGACSATAATANAVQHRVRSPAQPLIFHRQVHSLAGGQFDMSRVTQLTLAGSHRVPTLRLRLPPIPAACTARPNRAYPTTVPKHCPHSKPTVTTTRQQPPHGSQVGRSPRDVRRRNPTP